MSCPTFADQVDPLIDGLLPESDAAVLRAHAAACAACGEDLRRAERFRTFLDGAGRELVAAAADRDLVRAARASDAARRPAGAVRRWRAPLAAAALLVATVGATTWVVERIQHVSEGEVALVRGERRILGEGRTVVADGDVRLVVLTDDGSRVRLADGLAEFQVEHGRPFTVETELGDVEVRGTLFHVARRADRSVSVGVASGSVAFRAATGGSVRVLRAGSWLDVAPSGAQRLVSPSSADELETRMRAQTAEIESLRGEAAAKEDAIAALRREIAAAASLVGTAPAPTPDPWTEIGAATHKLLGTRPDAFDTKYLEAMSPFVVHAKLLREATGSTDFTGWLWHPHVVTRSARGFVDALAPDAPEAARAQVVEAIRAAAEANASNAWEAPVPAETAISRLRTIRDVVVAVRDSLGVAPAAEIARVGPAVAIWPLRSVTDDDGERRRTLDGVARFHNLTDEQKVAATPLIDRWVTQSAEAQAQVVRDFGEDILKDVLWLQRGPKVAVDDAQLVETSIRRIDARRILIAPWVEYQRALWQILPEEQRNPRPKGFGEGHAPRR